MRAFATLALAASLAPAPVSAQVLASPPNGIILPNYDLVRLGQWEAIESGAVVARTDGPLANVYNPSGLAASAKSEINGSATGFQYTRISLEGLGQETSASRFSTLSGFLGIVLAQPVLKSNKWRLGFSVFSPINWEPGTLSGEVQTTSGGTDVLLDYRTQVGLHALVSSLAAGVKLSPKLRVGAAFQVPVVTVRQTQATSALSTSATAASTVDRTYMADGTTWLVRATAGVQWDVAPAVSLGLAIETPTARLFGSTFYSDQLTSSSGLGFESVQFRDPKARLAYKLPLLVAGGAAFHIGKLQLEGDLRWYASLSQFDLYTSDSVGIAVSDSGANPPVLAPVQLVPVTLVYRSIVNFAIGANYPLSQRWQVHAGFNSDQSPLANTNEIFRTVSLYGGTAGVSLTASHLSGSVGLGFQTGNSPPTPVGIAAQVRETRLKVTTVQLLYAIAYSF